MRSFKKNIYQNASDDDCPDCIAHDVLIDSQTWTGCNANTKFYNNGDPIPYVDDPTTWISLTTGAWCYVNGDPLTESTYGIFYNWYAVTDPRGFAPVGYHVPTDAEWTVLINYLGGLSIAGGKMKETGLCHWRTPNTGATNTSLFTGLPSGGLNKFGAFTNFGDYGLWWSSTETSPDNAYSPFLIYNSDDAYISQSYKESGLSVRFIKD
jgi:uncharacterized protein (TIGR02145 family)